MGDILHLSRICVAVNKTEVVHKVTEKDNRLGFGDDLPGASSESLKNVDLYAVQKELYLGKKCEVADDKTPWQFWMIMLKNGNLDTAAGLCPKDGNKVGPFPPDSRFPCFGKGCMNQPRVFHNSTILKGSKLSGRFYGTYDLDGDISEEVDTDSYFSVTWEKELGKGGWSFHHVLKTSKTYPWLMLYLRSDATSGFSGGYHYETRGMTTTVSHPIPLSLSVYLSLAETNNIESLICDADPGISQLQGEAHAGHHKRRRSGEPVLLDGHGQLLEEQRRPLRRGRDERRHPVQRDDTESPNRLVVPGGQPRFVPPLPHLTQRDSDSPD
ncbi:hypothetical protein BHE74_00046433 [Ensete ventricosum]|nr:hypothetical protein BHE74_00046433 [Ensete ventricosum]